MLPASGNDLADRACDCLLSLLSSRHVIIRSGGPVWGGKHRTMRADAVPEPSDLACWRGDSRVPAVPRPRRPARFGAEFADRVARWFDLDLDLDRSAPRGGDGGRCQRAAGKRRGLVRFGPWMLEAPPALGACTCTCDSETEAHTLSLSPCQPVTFSFTWAGIASPLRPVPTPQFPWGACTRRHLGPCAAGT